MDDLTERMAFEQRHKGGEEPGLQISGGRVNSGKRQIAGQMS